MMDETGQDGINGTDSGAPTDKASDNVKPLFPERPSAAPLGPQEDVIELLQEFAHAAVDGRITGIMIIGFNETGQHKEAMSGKIPFSFAITGLEKMKFGILARDFSAQLNAAQPK